MDATCVQFGPGKESPRGGKCVVCYRCIPMHRTTSCRTVR